jgi:hypothetical protein
MQNPASPPRSGHTCPTCKRHVEPGYKFCDACGAQMPVLSTCSKCGTQFITPDKFCALCGAPMIMGKEPIASDSPEYSEEENTGPVENQIAEQEDEEIPEPGTDELPEDMNEENTGPDEEEIPDTDEVPEDNEEAIVPDEDETPHHDTGDTREPDTELLLEQFGAEYDDEETLESSHKPPSETVDDALFFSPNEQKAPAKPRVNIIKIIGGFVVLAAIIAAVYFIGLPMLTTGFGGFGSHNTTPAAEITPVPTITGAIPSTRVTTPAPSSGALVPVPTQQVPGQKFYFYVQKNPITSIITVSFAGSAGEGTFRSADIKVSHPDGSVGMSIIQPLKGTSEITIGGSKEADRVEIFAQMSSGQTYRVYDALVP